MHKETLKFVGVLLLAGVFIFLAVWIGVWFINSAGEFVESRKTRQAPVWLCGLKVTDIEIICKDGYEGCSKKYKLEDGSFSLLTSSVGKTNENGQLCVKHY